MDLSKEYGVHTTFNVTNLIPFTYGFEEDIHLPNLRTNTLQEGGDDNFSPIIGPIKGQITRNMLRRIQEDIEHKDYNRPNELKMLFTWAKEDIKI